MSEHVFQFRNDDFDLSITMKRDGENELIDGQVWGRLVDAVMTTLREPVAVLKLSPEEAEELKASWIRKFRT